MHRVEPQDGPALSLTRLTAPSPRANAVLFHGYAAASDQLRPLVPPLQQLGFDILLPDFRGSGGSDGNETTAGYQEAHDVLNVLDWAQRRDPERPRLVYGFSMGAAALLRAASLQPLCGPDQAPTTLVIEAVFDRMLTTLKNRFNLMGLPGSPGSELLLFWGSVSGGFDGFGHQPLTYAAQTECPVLVLHGAQDPRARVREGHAVYAALPGQKRWVAFEGLGHALAYTAQPTRWEQVVQQWVAQTLDVTAPKAGQ